MKKFFGLIAWGGACQCRGEFGRGAHLSPVIFSYSRHYDGTVCLADKNPVDPRWAAEAKSRESEFSLMWEREAPVLFGQVFKDFGKGFSRKEITATLTACPVSASFSNPLVLRVLPYLKSFMGEAGPRPDYGFSRFSFS